MSVAIVLTGAAVVATLAAIALHVVILVYIFKNTKRMGFWYVGVVVLAGGLWFAASRLMAQSIFGAGDGQVNEEGMGEFEQQIKQLDEMKDVQIELPTN